jgi:prepilin-type processing-associated H-X9-DG protein
MIMPYMDQSAGYALFNFGQLMTATVNVQAAILNLPMFQCPSESSPGFVTWPTSSTTSSGRTNYVQNMGLSSTYFDTTQTATFYAGPGVKFRDITDGMSNTALFAEIKRGRGAGSTTATNIVIGSIDDYASPVYVTPAALGAINNPYNPAQCNITLLTQTRFTGRGNQYYRGLTIYTFYNHTLVPNSPFRDCVTSVNFAEGHMAARSYHTGGAHVLLGDGSVRFASENIDGGVWRAVGSRANSEVVGDW